jgi:hypothetical protein
LDDYETIEYWMIISLKKSSIWQVGKFWESQIMRFHDVSQFIWVIFLFGILMTIDTNH